MHVALAANDNDDDDDVDDDDEKEIALSCVLWYASRCISDLLDLSQLCE